MGATAESNVPKRGDARRAAIHDAAIAEFSAHGIRNASMARIAEGAGVSRPALYQYFANKDEIFFSAFVALFEEHAERAVAALTSEGSVADQLDGFLQRFAGDLWERLAASEHADEIERAKTGALAEAAGEVRARLFRSLDSRLRDLGTASGPRSNEQHQGWLDLLQLSSHGLRADQPPIDVYRTRLTALAASVASDIEAAQATRAS